MNLFDLVLKSIYFMLPVYFANMAPVFLAKIPCLREFDLPVDFGKKLGRKRIFGSHKTWRGFIGGVAASIIFVLIQKSLLKYEFWNSISILDYASVNIILFGFLLGLGAMTGDLVKSFFKRRIGKKPGESWPVFDQLDYVIGALLFGSIVFVPELSIILIILIVTPVLNLLANYLGYILKLKKVWW